MQKGYFFKQGIDVKGEQNYLSVFLFCTEFSKDTSAFVELSHDTFTFFTDNVLFFNVTELSQYICIL
jgi:hypothetical protein